MKYQVKFLEVGRNKKTWTKDYADFPSEAQLLREVRKSNALTSSGIDVELIGNAGSIWVGGFRKVGSVEIQEYKAVSA